jgi:small subunit ribosomal protein S20
VANIKSQIKRNRQNDKKRLRNRVYRGTARIAVRTARAEIEEGTPESKVALMQAISDLDRAATHGVIHRNNAARRKSRLMKAFAKMEPAPVAAVPAEGELPVVAEPVKKKVSSRRTTRKVEEPAAVATEAAAEPKTPKTKKVAASSKAKTAEAKKPAAKTTAKKKPAATKES